MIKARRAARERLYPAIEAVWRLFFRLDRRLRFAGHTPRSWQAGGKILVVAPHPDDETIGAGGVLVLHRRRGDPVTVAVVTDGSGSRAGDLDPRSMAHRRSQELAAAMRVLGLPETTWLGLPEGAWRARQLQQRLAPLVGKADVIYAPSCVDFHPEHLRVARHLAEMVRPHQTIRVYELGVPLTPILVNLVADTGPVVAKKRRALSCFVTQGTALAPLARLARYRAAFYGLAAAEVFWEMPGRAYQRLMRAGAGDRGKASFRGIRPRPFDDPLAFLKGRKARQRLRLLSQADTL